MRRTTIVALVVLRLVIGWHFLFEGLHKVHLWFVGESETSKPFTSEIYFREATGPLGPGMRDKLANPDADALARLTPGGASPQEGVPATLAAEWDAYPGQLAEVYELDDKQKAALKKLVDDKKVQVAQWLMNDQQPGQPTEVPALKPFKKTYPSGTLEVPMTTPERVAYYRALLAEADFWKHQRSDALRKPLDKDQQARLRGEIAAIRQDLLTDLDKFTTALKDEMAAVVRKPLTDFAFWDKGDRVEQVQAWRREKGDALPSVLSGKIEGYQDLFIKTYHLPEPQAALVRDQAKHTQEEIRLWLASDKVTQQLAYFQMQDVDHTSRTASYPQRLGEFVAIQAGPFLAGQPFLIPVLRPSVAPGDPAAAQDLFYRATIAPRDPAQDKADATKALTKGYDDAIDSMKKMMGLVLENPKNKAYPPDPVKAKRFIDWVDIVTMWTLTVAGALLLIGLFPRLAGLVAAGFLLLTYLTYPPFPWLPTPPNTEGNPLFVNKNVIEFAALLVLLTVPSGRWFGVDALVSWMFRSAPRPADAGSGAVHSPASR